MAEGWQAYQFGQFDKAILWFEAAAKKAPANSEAQAKALYALGTAFQYRRPTAKPELALENYKKVLEIAPNSDVGAWALYSIARLDAIQKAEVQILSKEAREKILASYQQVIDKYPESAAGQEALLMQQALKVASLDPVEVESAVVRLKEFLQAHPDSAYQSAVWGVLGSAYEFQKKYPEQLNAMIRSFETLDVDPTNPIMVKSSLFWSIATVAEYKVGDLETAKKYHRILQERFPRDFLVFSSRNAVARLEQKQAELRQEASSQTPAAPTP